MKGQLFLPCDSTRLWWFEEIMSLGRNYIGFQTILWTCRNKNRMTAGNSVKGLNVSEPLKKKKGTKKRSGHGGIGTFHLSLS